MHMHACRVLVGEHVKSASANIQYSCFWVFVVFQYASHYKKLNILQYGRECHGIDMCVELPLMAYFLYSSGC